MENVFIERLWQSLKYECVYLHALEPAFDILKAGVHRSHRDTFLEAREAQIERSEGEWVFCVSHDGEAISGRWGSHPSSNVQGRTWRAQPAAEPPSLLEGQGKEGSALQSRAVGRHTKTATVGTPFMVASRSCACRGISLCEQRSRRCDLVPQT